MESRPLLVAPISELVLPVAAIEADLLRLATLALDCSRTSFNPDLALPHRFFPDCPIPSPVPSPPASA